MTCIKLWEYLIKYNNPRNKIDENPVKFFVDLYNEKKIRVHF